MECFMSKSKSKIYWCSLETGQKTWKFARPLNNWNVSNVTDMEGVFAEVQSFTTLEDKRRMLD